MNMKNWKSVTVQIKLPVCQDVYVVLGLSVRATVELGVLTLGMQFPLGARVCNILHHSSASRVCTEANKQATCGSRIVKARNVFVTMITIRLKSLH